MKETRVPPAHAANLVANSGNDLYGVYVITQVFGNFSSIMAISLC